MKRLLHSLFICLVFGSSSIAFAKAKPAVSSSQTNPSQPTLSK